MLFLNPRATEAASGMYFSQRREKLRFSSEKEVIQPQVPLRLPCYDLVPITKLAFGAVLLAVGLATSGALSFRGLTGGVYKAQEHIHRSVADLRLLANPASCRRVAAYNPNWGLLWGLASHCCVATLCTDHCSTCVAQGIRAMMT